MFTYASASSGFNSRRQVPALRQRQPSRSASVLKKAGASVLKGAGASVLKDAGASRLEESGASNQGGRCHAHAVPALMQCL
eukprot:1147678-Pelagomonas_calceolata.AAC.7